MKKFFALASVFCVAATLSCRNTSMVDTGKIGSPLPQWEEGMLDIHFINSGRGECAFLILPDGTTMVVDCGDIPDSKKARWPEVDPKPFPGDRAYKVDAEYIRHFLPEVSGGMIDYFNLSHFHIDHMGTASWKGNEISPNGYALTGVMGLYDLVPFRTLVDRGYPDYDAALERSTAHSNIEHYRKFVSYAISQGMKAERFRIGADDQFVLRNNPEAYPEFSTFNYACDGRMWQGGEVVDLYAGEKPKENGASCCFLVKYGDFEYLTCGDAGANSAVEIPLAHEIGHRIEAMKGSHHMAWGTHTKEAMAILQPGVIVVQNFTSHKPWIPAMETTWEGSPKTRIYTTNLYPENLQKEDVQRSGSDHGGSAVTDEVYAAETGKLSSHNGHVVIRVEKGGARYRVYVLDDTNYEYRIKQIDGPFKSE